MVSRFTSADLLGTKARTGAIVNVSVRADSKMLAIPPYVLSINAIFEMEELEVVGDKLFDFALIPLKMECHARN